jgi:dihydropteroate synthase
MHWQCGSVRLNGGPLPLIMGVLNTTPDSFSDGGRFLSVDAALIRAREMIAQGADIIDVGGESTRPGAEPVDATSEMRRVLPVIEALASGSRAVISVDTTKASVAREAVRLGACIINDVSAMTADPAMAATVRDTGAGVVLMHMRGNPRTMQDNPQYADVTGEVARWLAARIAAAAAAGIAPEAVAVDPGIGFGKTVTHNAELISGLARIADLGRPVLAGMSRKRFIGALAGVPDAGGRLAGSLAALACAVLQGATILRVHDVAESVQAARVAAAIRTPALVPGLTEGSL